jgi:ribosomal protein S27E
MSTHYIHINCPRCDKTESVYTGSQDTEDFDDSDWEGSFIYTDCIECKGNNLAVLGEVE